MAVGGIFAYILYFKRVMISRQTIIFIYLLTLAMMATELTFKLGLHHLLYSIIFGAVIYSISISTNEKSLLEFKFFKYLGKVSYGIYMWHVVSINLVLYFWGERLDFNSKYHNILLHASAILLTVIIASISYEMFEIHFLKLKNKLSRIIFTTS